MKKKIISALMVMMIGMMGMTGCSSSAGQGIQNDKSSGNSERTELANPWTESDKQGVEEATGFEMTAPDGATEVAYSYMSEDGLAQMSYVMDGMKWNYRMQATDALTDISGMEYQWLEWTECSVAGLDATYCGYNAASNDATESVQILNWYDAVTGVTYSLSATGKELSDTEMLTYAESLYAPLQGEVTGDPAEDEKR